MKQTKENPPHVTLLPPSLSQMQMTVNWKPLKKLLFHVLTLSPFCPPVVLFFLLSSSSFLNQKYWRAGDMCQPVLTFRFSTWEQVSAVDSHIPAPTTPPPSWLQFNPNGLTLHRRLSFLCLFAGIKQLSLRCNFSNLSTIGGQRNDTQLRLFLLVVPCRHTLECAWPLCWGC